MTVLAKILEWSENHFDELMIVFVPALILIACHIYAAH